MTNDLNKKYNLINKMIDNYIEDWGISPKNLIKYLKKGSRNYDRFIQRTGIEDMKDVDKILKDVLDDRRNMMLDGILTFESFIQEQNIKESVFYNVEESNIDYEKKIADFMDTNLSHIEVVDSKKHLYNVNVFGDISSCVIYNDNDITNIIKHCITTTLDSLFKKGLKVDFDTDLIDVSIPLMDILDYSDIYKRIEDKLTEELIVKYISELIQKEHGISFKFNKVDDFYIWRE